MIHFSDADRSEWYVVNDGVMGGVSRRDEEWITARITFDQFLATFRGRTLSDAPPMDASHIHQAAFMLADKKPGPFSLEIDYVRSWERVNIDP